jgi:lysophospholipase L1-like esterase
MLKSHRSPWLTAALLGLAGLLPWILDLPAKWRPITIQQLRQAFVDPFLGQSRARLWERIQPTIAQPALKPRSQFEKQPSPAVKQPGGDPRIPDSNRLLADPSAADLLSDPSGALGHFHAALARTEQGDGLTRIVHFGDSVVTGDLITGEARARLQCAYGDGGPGWIYPQRPWEWYGRLGLNLKGKGWRIHSPLLVGRPDRNYGLAGIDFAGANGAETAVSTGKTQPFEVVELHYLAQPKGGRIQVQVERGLNMEVPTEGEPGPAVKSIQLPAEGVHNLLLRATGEARLYGVVLERKGPGVVYDPLGQNGYAIQHLAKINSQHWIQALRLRRPDLVVLAFGTNEVGYYNIPGPAYAADYREIVRRIREALPAASILVMGPMDRGARNPEGALGTMPNLIRIVEAQRKIAAELGVAFFDTYRAMGGEGSAVRGYNATPRLMTGDFTHPTRSGADRIARSLVDALVARQQAWKGAQPPP